MFSGTIEIVKNTVFDVIRYNRVSRINVETLKHSDSAAESAYVVCFIHINSLIISSSLGNSGIYSGNSFTYFFFFSLLLSGMTSSGF